MHKFNIIKIVFLVTSIMLLGFYLSITPSQKKENSLYLSKEEVQFLSENLGHLLADTLHEYAPYYDFQIVMHTVKRIENKEEPLKSPDTCQLALIDLKSKMIEEEINQNLNLAEQFLADLSHKNKVVEVQKNKLYYEVLQEGTGSTSIDKNSTPVFHFTETNLSNRIIRDTREQSQPIQIKLSETITGFQLGVSGMKVGERRKIYVHPNLAYGKLSRQQLSIFDVEIIGD